MGKHRKRDAPPADYEVGYGRTPVGTRFQSGKSGNPRGRPKGVKSIGKQLTDALARRVTVQENGRPRKMSMRDVIIQGLVNDAARREPRAVQLLFSLIDRYGDGQDAAIDAAALLPDDEAIIRSYIEAAQAREGSGEPEPPEPPESPAEPIEKVSDDERG